MLAVAGYGYEFSSTTYHLVKARFPQAHSTDVPTSSLCPPRRWSGAGVGAGMLRGAGVFQIFKFSISRLHLFGIAVSDLVKLSDYNFIFENT